MNIFVLDRNPVKSAQMMCDAHVCKMAVESCQLLSTHARIEERFRDSSGLYKATHINHPCRLALSNPYTELWLITHLWALLTEYNFRFGKIHKTAEVYSPHWHGVTVPIFAKRDDLIAMCTFPKCMPDEFKVGGDDIDSVVQSYRNYYKYKQQTLKRFRYTKRTVPEWLGGDAC